jgi:hypothetical protein
MSGTEIDREAIREEMMKQMARKRDILGDNPMIIRVDALIRELQKIDQKKIILYRAEEVVGSPMEFLQRKFLGVETHVTTSKCNCGGNTACPDCEGKGVKYHVEERKYAKKNER